MLCTSAEELQGGVGWRRHGEALLSPEELQLFILTLEPRTDSHPLSPLVTQAAGEREPRSVHQFLEGRQSEKPFKADARGHVWSAGSALAKQDGC